MKTLHALPVLLSAVLLFSAIALNRNLSVGAQEAEITAPVQNNAAVTPPADEEEMRGVWVTYMTLDMQNTERSKSEFEAKAEQIAVRASQGGFNTLIVQVRPFCDALYKSKIFPFSHVISGEQGKESSYDPLKIMCEKAHKNGLKIHAWINPYRIKTTSFPQTLSRDNPYVKNPDLAVELDSGIYFNPAFDDVTKLITDGVTEIVENYDVDGIQFDDYFYPTQDAEFDREQYEEYKQSVGEKDKPMSLSEWRMDNVNRMLKSVYNAVHSGEKNIVFGISPQGNLANNSGLSADVVRWYTQSGYADYICPQIYFSLDNPALTFENALSDWTALESADGVRVYVGIAGYKAGTDSDGGTWEDNSDILKREIEIIRDNELDGFMLYSYDSLVGEESQEEIQNVISLLNS